MPEPDWDALKTSETKAREEAEELAVFDFLQWLAPQNIELHQLIPGGCSEAVDGELWERWKAERNA